MKTEITTDPYYRLLVEDCRAIVTESVFASRWALVEGYHLLGERIVTDENYQQYAKGNQQSLQDLANNIGIGERTLYYAIRFYNKYPELDNIPEGKNISWNKLITKYLPEYTGKEKVSEYQRISKGIERWSKSIEGIIDQTDYDRISAHIIEIRNILNDYAIQDDIDDAEERNWMEE